MYPTLYLSTLLVATALASTDFPFASFKSMTGLQRRNTCYQQNPTCVSCFGAGSIECVDPSSCYNPTQGETCCSDSSYYCADNGCCPNGSSLADCGATATVATVAPPASTSSAVSAAPDSTSSLYTSTYTVMSTTSTSTPAPMTPIYAPSTSDSSSSPSSSSTTSTPTTPATSTSPTPSAATATVPAVIAATPATSSSSSSSSSTSPSAPAQQTTNAGNRRCGAIGLALGGLGVVLFAL
ncbi:hypothetical protein LTR02_006835 [Friedmanniomyces endolithicus]|nr:hypothetical protein LTR59_007759 [Friedmanniomyces endolithicus]KAK0797904.1 hypothetical protein LTR75_009721 [Friedmanniomyces endolithicus]KAK0800638.1 hypothetical protein LTR38_007072 [Friedmanniomyces endolithicus]KAK0849069.1 hypothetical protein LTR03_005394 [Friedmanniomyces endolithicus]KAK0904812.1 hypothetical protein LTR02_006835 [Friedmanniomyces endolithicus]